MKTAGVITIALFMMSAMTSVAACCKKFRLQIKSLTKEKENLVKEVEILRSQLKESESGRCDVNAQCICKAGFSGDGKTCKKSAPKSCSEIKALSPLATSGTYLIDPDGEGGFEPFNVSCDMTDKDGVGVTVIGHDSEDRTLVDGYEGAGSYVRDVHYSGASVAQLAGLTNVSAHCEQFIKFECYNVALLYMGNPDGWWVSRDGNDMTYWGGATPADSYKCACGVTSPNSCADPNRGCNCDKNDNVWREDSGLLTEKSDLPVSQLRFGDTGSSIEKGYHTLGKLKCYGIA